MGTADCVMLSLRGEFDIADRERLNLAFAQLASRTNVIIDLADVTYIDSVVITSLVEFKRVLTEHGGSLRIVGARGNVERIFAVCRLNRLIDIQTADAPVFIAPTTERIELSSSTPLASLRAAGGRD